MRKILSFTTSLAVAAASMVLLSPNPTSATMAGAAAAAKEPTRFALYSSSYGSRVNRGDLPVGSDGTSYNVIGCTHNAGVERENFEADVVLPGIGDAEGVYTRLFTTKDGDVVSSVSTHKIAKLTLGEDPSTQLVIEGITSVARAFHDGNSFKTESSASIASISQGGEALDIPASGETLTFPGLAEIKFGKFTTRTLPTGLQEYANALVIKVFPSNTISNIAHTTARIETGIKSGVFRGFGAATRARGLQDNVRSGRTPLTILPCQGTNGKIKTRSIAILNLDDQIVANGLKSSTFGKQTRAKATGGTRGQVAELNLGNGELIVEAVVAQANVTRTADGKLTRNADGTTIGLVNGEEFPSDGTLNIPGVAKLESKLVTNIKNGISVIGLRITLLDGSGAEIDLGIAEIRIKPSGLRSGVNARIGSLLN